MVTSKYTKTVIIESVVGEGQVRPAKPIIETRDPKHIIRLLLDATIDPGNVTKDDDLTPAKYIDIYGYPPNVLIEDYLKTDYDAVISVDRVKALDIRLKQNQPRRYDTVLKIGIWTISKTGITGEKLKWKLYEELRRVFRAEEDYQHIIHEEDNDHPVEGQEVYNINLYVLHEMYWWDFDEEPFGYWLIAAFLNSTVDSHIPSQTIVVVTSTEDSHAPETSKIASITSVVSDRAP